MHLKTWFLHYVNLLSNSGLQQANSCCICNRVRLIQYPPLSKISTYKYNYSTATLRIAYEISLCRVTTGTYMTAATSALGSPGQIPCEIQACDIFQIQSYLKIITLHIFSRLTPLFQVFHIFPFFLTQLLSFLNKVRIVLEIQSDHSLQFNSQWGKKNKNQNIFKQNEIIYLLTECISKNESGLQ